MSLLYCCRVARKDLPSPPASATENFLFARMTSSRDVTHIAQRKAESSQCSDQKRYSQIAHERDDGASRRTRLEWLWCECFLMEKLD
jgi:hypothetical protein